MRSWLTQFLRNPRPLPPDPGSGHERISLTLPRGLVQTIAFDLGCPPSQALRRLAGEYLGLPERVRTPSEPFLRPTSGEQSREDTLGAAVAQLIASAVTLALILLVVHFSSKGKKHV